MKVSRTGGTGGAWIDKSTLKTGDKIKLVTEAAEIEGQHGPQLVAKCRVQGMSGEAVNVAINAPSRNALIDAYGDDTALWANQVLTANIEKTTIAGKRQTILYLVPDGFELIEDDGGYLVIVRRGGKSQSILPPAPASSEDTRDVPDEAYDDVPF